VETSGFTPVPEEPGGFSPMPVPTPDGEAPAAEGWTYSYAVESPDLAGAAPVEAPAAETHDPVPPAAPAPSYEFAPSPDLPARPYAASHRAEPHAEPALTAQLESPQLDSGQLESPQPYVPEQVAAATVPLSAVPAFPGDVVSLDAPDTGVQVAESEAEESAYSRTSTETAGDEDDINLNDLLVMVLDRGASDLHLTTGARPAIRLNGELVQIDEQPILTPPVIQRVMYAALTQRQREKFEENLELDFAYSVPGRARFRVNMYRQRDALGAAFRIIPFEIRKLEDLGVPPSVANFASLPRGFVLVTGPTGSGKSTTLAALIDLANRTRSEHIMTVEDPIEFLHRHQKCIINQREVGEDTWSFQNALKHVLRQDPDIILVGEMRDLETISVALTAAETGHLVFATLHTQDAAQTIDRVIDVFPPHLQQQVRVQLAGSLQGVVCQTLAKTRDGRGRAVATEVLVATPAVRNLIREGKTHQIYSAMQAGAKHGMHTMDQHIADLVMKGTITYEVGLEKCHHVEDFNRLTGRG
jgi:twitching motility protein PilT